MKRLSRYAVGVLSVGAILLVVALIILPAALGLQRYVITGGSMSGSISKGSVIYSRLTPVEQLEVGDIITFLPPGFRTPVTHRIIEIASGPDGQPVFRTKGDANAEADPWQINLQGPSQARYVLQIPLLGYLLGLLTIRWVRMLIIGVPAVLIALSLLVSLWRQSGEDVRGEVPGGEAAAAPTKAAPHSGPARGATTASTASRRRRVRPVNATGRPLRNFPTRLM